MARRRLLLPNTPELRSLVHTLMDEYDCRDARAVSQRTGGNVSHQTIHEMLRGNTSVVQMRTLTELATAFRVDVNEFIRSTEGQSPPWRMPRRFDVVPIHLRLQIERLLSSLLTTTGVIPEEKKGRAPAEEQP